MTEGFEKEQYKNHLIMQILNSTCIEGIEIFIENMDLLKDVSFIVPNLYCDGNNYIEPFQSLKLRDIEVNYFFNNKFLYCYTKMFINMFHFKTLLQIRILIGANLSPKSTNNFTQNTI